MKLDYFVDESPMDYEKLNSDSSKHLRYHDYKHLKNIEWEQDTESLLSKVVAGIALVLTLLFLIFIATF